MRGSLTKIDLYAHRKRLWGKYYADNCDRKSRKTANKPHSATLGRLLWLSTANGQKAQGTYRK